MALEQFQEISAPESVSTIPMLDLILLLSKASDIYHVSQAFPTPVIDVEPNTKILFNRMHNVAKDLLTVITENIQRKTNQKLISVGTELTRLGIGDVLTKTEKSLAKANEKQLKVLEKFAQTKDLFEYNLLGHHLMHGFILEKFKYFAASAQDTFNQSNRKISEEIHRHAAEIITQNTRPDDIINSEVEKTEQLNNIVSEMNTIFDVVLKKYELIELAIAFHHYDDLLRLGMNLQKFILSTDEIDHLVALLTEFYNDPGKEYPADIARAIFSLKKIQPIYTLKVTNIPDFLCGLSIQNKALFIYQNFGSPSSPVYQTYEGIGVATSVYTQMIEIFNKMRSALIPTEKNKKLRAQINRYTECFENYFQLSMRFNMPMNETQSNFKKVLALLDKRGEGKQKAEVRRQLEAAIVCLGKCEDILKQKTLQINAATDVVDYISKLQDLIKQDKASSSFFSNLLTKSYSSLIQSVLNYLMSISQSSRNEGQTNYLAISEKLAELFKQHDFDFEKARTSKEPRLVLLLQIYQRYEKNAKNYQSPVKESPVLANKPLLS